MNTTIEQLQQENIELRNTLNTLTFFIEKLTAYKHVISYNDSYFGEPTGLLKQVLYELDRNI